MTRGPARQSIRQRTGYARRVDANAVRVADRHVLVGYAAAVAGNARDLLTDAELLLGAGRWARAYVLAVLAAEEWGKAYAVITPSFMPPEARARIPVRELLEGHRMKMAGALLMRILDAAFGCGCCCHRGRWSRQIAGRRQAPIPGALGV